MNPSTNKLFVILVALMAGLAVGVGVLNVLASSRRADPPPELPPVLGQVPAFTLTERSGEPMGLADLEGRVWVAAFVFTRCRETCPLMTAELARLHARLSERGWGDARLLAISIDPEHDTPEVLRDYARAALTTPASQGHGDKWKFLTGEKDAIWTLAEKGFMVPVEAAADPETRFFHSTKFILVDRQGRIRGYYGGLDPDDRERLWQDLHAVEAEGA